MITKLAVTNYRSLLSLTVGLDRLNVITGRNGSGKSNLYRALRLLAETARGGVVSSLAREGGMSSTLWAGPEKLTAGMKSGRTPIQGGLRKGPVRMRLGFTDEQLGYAISLGYPKPSSSSFSLDPEIKRECIWSGDVFSPARLLLDRNGAEARIRTESGWRVVSDQLNEFETIFTQVGDPRVTPEVLMLREVLQGWRFYDQFRTDQESPVRQPQPGTRTMVLHNDGRDLAAALQTIREIGDEQELDHAIEDAFPGTQLNLLAEKGEHFELRLDQHGMLRPLKAQELSDGTLRYLCWVAALLTPRPPALMVLNEPENSLHPELVPALARLIVRASEHTQVWVVSHSSQLVAELQAGGHCRLIELHRELGETEVRGQDLLSKPNWKWPE